MRRARTLLLLTLLGVVAWRTADEPLEPYPLRYPAEFGGRFRIPPDNPLTREGVALGRRLFYEKRLSSTGTIACATCHQPERAFTDGRARSIGVSGVPTRRNSMALVNLLWVRNLFWDGRASSLEAQALVPLTHPDEMGLRPGQAASILRQTAPYPALFRRVFRTDSLTDDHVAKALAQFERTLISADSPYDRYLRGQYALTETEARGLKLFTTASDARLGRRGGNCAHCHGGPRLEQDLFHTNGLDRQPVDSGRGALTRLPLDQGRFRVPTLRNIALTAPYMHDGRFATLEAVVDHYSDRVQPHAALPPELVPAQRGGLGLTRQEKGDLLAFLRLLTDSAFVCNPQFADPRGAAVVR
jgi:cytochrome c peroxidase